MALRLRGVSSRGKPHRRDGDAIRCADARAPVDAVCDGCISTRLRWRKRWSCSRTSRRWWQSSFGTWIEVAAVASIWLATGTGGAQRSPERLLWSIAATLWFTPVFHANYFGNVGSIVALMVTFVAMGGVAAGIASGLGPFLKVSPGALIPGAVAQGRQSRRAFAATVAVVGVISLVASPQAWIDYATVLPNMLEVPRHTRSTSHRRTPRPKLGYPAWSCQRCGLLTSSPASWASP